jgi:hypothetical protein
MKKLLFLALLFVGVSVYAAPAVIEQPIIDHGTAGSVSVSTSAWTAVPTTPTSGRTGMFVTVQSSATANMHGHIGTSSTPTLSTSRHPIVLKPGITQYHALAQNEYLYLISKHTSSERVEYQEVKQ